MIPRRELEHLASEWSLAMNVVEKDCALGWLLAGVANHPALSSTWIFKGGTCLRKCYYETYRFSEDLDFTVIGDGPTLPTDLVPIFHEISEWVSDVAGVRFLVDDRSFKPRQNKRGNPTAVGRVGYAGPNPQPTSPKIKIDLTADEVLTQQPVLRPIGHDYSDGPLPVRGVASYPITELFGEKLRALSERCRPRDLYDVVHLHRHPDLIGHHTMVYSVLQQKCAHSEISVPTIESMKATPFREEIEGEWANMLGHQLPKPLPPFDDFWSTLDDVFHWLYGRRSSPILQRAQGKDLDQQWTPPRAITSWRRSFPLELIRYAGANRLKISIDYRPERGRSGPRICEPYALRRTKGGRLVLFVVNDLGNLRSYRVDRIAGIRPTQKTFTPRFRVEF